MSQDEERRLGERSETWGPRRSLERGHMSIEKGRWEAMGVEGKQRPERLGVTCGASGPAGSFSLLGDTAI